MKKDKTGIFVHAFFVLFALVCFLPFMMVISASLTETRDLTLNGFSILPRKIDTSSYAYLFANPKMIIDGYKVTIFVTIVGTVLGLFVMTLVAYPLSRPGFKLKKFVTWYLFIPTLFGGGMASSYIINTRYLHLTDNIWILILPGVLHVYHVFMIRTFFSQLPDGLFEAAKIDGAGEFRIYFSLALRLSKPILATISFLGALGRWNVWYEAMMYIRSADKYPLQYLLQRMMRNLEELKRAMEKYPDMVTVTEVPGENLRMALLVVCIGPMMLFFPFFQKYFTRGMTVGAVKG